MRYYYRLILGAGIFIIVAGTITIILEPNRNSALFDNLENQGFIEGNFYELREFIEESVVQAQRDYQDKHQNQSKTQYTQIGITSHHLPTAAPLISDLYTQLIHSQGPRDVFVILGPDHWQRGHTPVSTTYHSFITPFGILETEKDIIDNLLKNGLNIDNECFEGEHSIGVQAIFIKLFFPEARIVPLILRPDTDGKKIGDIVEVLARYKDRITVIASVDFSHYRPYEYARVLDIESKGMLINLNFDSFDFKHADSPAALKIIGRLIQIFEATKVCILDIANSYDFTGNSDNTTGYINALFAKEIPGNTQTLMLVGDIMLSRAVGEKMKKENNWHWPFLKIADYLEEADLLFGNLEGPISDKGRNVGSIYSFRADPQVIEGLKYAGFEILSVANNHLGDWGKEAMEDTFRILKENGIDYVGGGYNEVEAHSPIIKELDRNKIAFLAYTDLGSRYWMARGNNSGIAWIDKERIQEDIKRAKIQAGIVIVSIHTGEEYAIHSNAIQRSLARTAVEAGADLVIGHHPHVIQEIEKHKDSYITYSLGNFVFDQTFSLETKHGWILKILIESGKIKKVMPIDIEISNDFQPALKDESLTLDDSDSIKTVMSESQSQFPKLPLSQEALFGKSNGELVEINKAQISEGKYIDIDLSRMILITFEDGTPRHVCEITAAGNPRGWPTPKGNFQVLHKEENHFSQKTYVWMPWSLHFYGDFYIHGVPYWPSGQEAQSTYSGGCIRIPTDSAKLVYHWAEIGTPIIIHQ